MKGGFLAAVRGAPDPLDALICAHNGRDWPFGLLVGEVLQQLDARFFAAQHLPGNELLRDGLDALLIDDDLVLLDLVERRHYEWCVLGFFRETKG